MAQDAVILHGNYSATPALASKVIRTRADGLSAGTATFESTDPSPFDRGDTHAALPGLFVEEISDTTDGGGTYIHEVAMLGLVGAERRPKGFPNPTDGVEDFDTVEDEFVTTNRSKFVRGNTTSAYGGIMVCVSANPKPEIGNVYRVRGLFKGLRDGARRLVSREITCNGETVQVENGVVSLPGGWNTPSKASLDLAKIVVVDTYLQTAAPRSGLVPGAVSPSVPPPVKNISWTAGAGQIIKHWPNGWKFTTGGQRPFGNVSLWRVQEIHEYQTLNTPG